MRISNVLRIQVECLKITIRAQEVGCRNVIESVHTFSLTSSDRWLDRVGVRVTWYVFYSHVLDTPGVLMSSFVGPLV